jgi:hypothetical protein
MKIILYPNSLTDVTALGIGKDALVYTEESLDDAQRATIADGGDPGFKKLKRVEYATYKSAQFNTRGGSTVTMKSGSQKIAPEQMIFSDTEAASAAFDQIAQVTGWTRSTKTLNPMSAAVVPGIGIAVTIFVGWLLAMGAAALAEGGEAEVNGRRRGLKRMLLWVTETLGPTGVWIIAGLIALGFFL